MGPMDHVAQHSIPERLPSLLFYIRNSRLIRIGGKLSNHNFIHLLWSPWDVIVADDHKKMHVREAPFLPLNHPKEANNISENAFLCDVLEKLIFLQFEDPSYQVRSILRFLSFIQVVDNLFPLWIACHGDEICRLVIFPDNCHCILEFCLIISGTPCESAWKDDSPHNWTSYISVVESITSTLSLLLLSPLLHNFTNIAVGVCSKSLLVLPNVGKSLVLHGCEAIQDELLKQSLCLEEVVTSCLTFHQMKGIPLTGGNPLSCGMPFI